MVNSCFAISGLASHPFGSWRARDNSGTFMWLRDALPKACPGVHPIIYGYDTHLVGSQSFKSIEDIAIAFTSQLKAIGCSLPSAKPTVFLAHSLGGVVLKQSLVPMARSGEWDVHLLSKIHKVVLFRVPNRGMKISHLVQMVNGQPNLSLVERLSPHDGYLALLDDQLAGISFHRNMRIVSVYETHRTQLPEVQCENSSGAQIDPDVVPTGDRAWGLEAYWTTRNTCR